MNIDEYEKRLIRRYPSSFVKKVHIDKANKDYILRYRRDGVNAELMLYDIEDNQPISYIEYELNKDNCYIGHFITDYDYQGQGLGKYLYQLTQAHAEKSGVTYSHGIIQPIGDIKGISNNLKPSYEFEMKFLMLTYHALGNNIQNVDSDNMNLWIFTDKWKFGEKSKKLNNEQSEYLNSMIKYDKKMENKTEHTK